jgi:hypothetical protein
LGKTQPEPVFSGGHRAGQVSQLKGGSAVVRKREPLRWIASQTRSTWRSKFVVLLIGVVSCIFVVSNLTFQKPFEPERVVQSMNQEPSTPLMVVVAYSNYQDVALGLSFALALEALRDVRRIASFPAPTSNFAFFKQSPSFESAWQKLSQIPSTTTGRLNLWIVAPGRRHQDYPQHLVVGRQSICNIDSKQYYRIGIPYQLYRCQ